MLLAIRRLVTDSKRRLLIFGFLPHNEYAGIKIDRISRSI